VFNGGNGSFAVSFAQTTLTAALVISVQSEARLFDEVVKTTVEVLGFTIPIALPALGRHAPANRRFETIEVVLRYQPQIVVCPNGV